MRIESVDLHHIRMRLKAPFETAFGVEHDRDAVIVRLRAEGIEGWGECVAGAFPGYSYETVGTAWHVMEEFFVPAILGHDLKDVDNFRGRLASFHGHPLPLRRLELA